MPITIEQLKAKFEELGKQINALLTQQIEIQGQIKLLQQQEIEKSSEAKLVPTDKFNLCKRSFKDLLTISP